MLPLTTARRSKVDQMKEIVTGNPTVIKMVVSFHRGARGQNALRQILAPVVKEIMDDKTLNIKTDPVDIYKSWVNQMETQTGEARWAGDQVFLRLCDDGAGHALWKILRDNTELIFI